MNVVTRGTKNALRSPIRSGAIVLMLAISIGLILSMLVARSSVDSKISEVKATSGTSISISPAGIQGFAGGGDALTSTELDLVNEIPNITSVVATLSDQMDSTDTSLESSLELGDFGARQMRFDSESSSDSSKIPANDNASIEMRTPTPRTTVTGTTDINSISNDSSVLSITSGETIDGNSSEAVALIGIDLAEKNSLTVGDTFTAYEETITVSGIYETENTFLDSGIVMPLLTLQTLTDLTDSISTISVKVDSSDNVATVVLALETALSDTADITSGAEQAEASVASLQSISNLALAGVIGSTIAGAVIVLLSMIMIVRERRREIGVIKAIGGTNFKVISQFMTEALTLTIIGSIIGLGLGVLVSGPMTTSLVSSSSTTSTETAAVSGQRAGQMLRGGVTQISNNFTDVTSSLTPSTFAVAVGMTLIIAVIGSAIPAWFIARVRPAEVLRSE